MVASPFPGRTAVTTEKSRCKRRLRPSNTEGSSSTNRIFSEDTGFTPGCQIHTGLSPFPQAVFASRPGEERSVEGHAIRQPGAVKFFVEDGCGKDRGAGRKC